MPEGEGPVAGVVVVDRGLVVGEGGERPALVLGVGVGLTRMGRASGGLSKEAGAGEGLFVGMPGTLPCSCFHELNLATMSEPEKANEAAAPAASILFLRAGGGAGRVSDEPSPSSPGAAPPNTCVRRRRLRALRQKRRIRGRASDPTILRRYM